MEDTSMDLPCAVPTAASDLTPQQLESPAPIAEHPIMVSPAETGRIAPIVPASPNTECSPTPQHPPVGEGQRCPTSTTDYAAKAPRKIISEKRLRVYISVNVVSLFSVDTVAETFKVRLSVTLVWPAVAEHLQEELNALACGLDDADVDWEPKWYPRYGIRNKVESQETVENFYSILIGAPSDSLVSSIQTGQVSKGNFWIVRESVSNVVINMAENLHNFPFDLQDLQIMIRMEHATAQVELVRIDELPQEVRKGVPPHISIPEQTVSVNFFNLNTAERCVRRKQPCKIKLSNDFWNRVRRHQCGAVQVGILVERRLGHYVYNVFLMVFCITSLVFGCWSIKIEDTGDRIACDFALVLTMQAFKLVIADKLPKVNYLTFVDKYIIICFLFLILGIVMHCWTGHLGLVWDSELDNTFKFVWLGLWLAWNLLTIMAWRVCKHRREQLLLQTARDDGFTFLQEKEVAGDRSRTKTASTIESFPVDASKVKDL